MWERESVGERESECVGVWERVSVGERVSECGESECGRDSEYGRERE